MAFISLDQFAAQNISKKMLDSLESYPYSPQELSVGTFQGEQSLEPQAKDPGLQNREGGGGRGSVETGDCSPELFLFFSSSSSSLSATAESRVL